MTLKKSLPSLFNEIILFTKNDFHPLSYIYTILFIFSCIFLNYNFGFYKDILRDTYFNGTSMWAFPVFYGCMYFAVAIPVLLFQKEYKTLRNPLFYLKSLFFIVLYGVAVGFYEYRNWDFPSLFSEEKLFVYRILSQLKGCAFFIVPLFLVKIIFDKNIDGLYGLASNAKHIRAYLVLFLMLLPFLIAISFTPDFKIAYPQFRPWLYDDVFGLPIWLNTLIFESTYSLDFVMTELLFRGALVIGMISILGRKAVLPMVAMYAAIHFGKPLGETISSVFGGYILGAFAYQTRHIWGGVIVHICIALTMEIMGFVHYYMLKV
ncbi:MAG: CPBP family intramembrane metalloprotease [Paludibacter sp.]|nr:CPBP family intramembrane metalloprotease [Paludibacter sp.]